MKEIILKRIELTNFKGQAWRQWHRQNKRV